MTNDEFRKLKELEAEQRRQQELQAQQAALSADQMRKAAENMGNLSKAVNAQAKAQETQTRLQNPPGSSAQLAADAARIDRRVTSTPVTLDRRRRYDPRRTYQPSEVVILDTETTGLERTGAQVVSTSYVPLTGRNIKTVYSRPTVPINPDATKVHGISLDAQQKKLVQQVFTYRKEGEKLVREATDRTVELESKSYASAIKELRKELSGAKVIAGYNVGFDRRVLSHSGVIPHTTAVLDVLRLARRLRPGLKSYALSNVYTPITGKPVDVTRTHQADYDVQMTRDVLESLMQDPRIRGDLNRAIAYAQPAARAPLERGVFHFGRTATGGVEPRISFGKHANTSLAELIRNPKYFSYVQYLANKIPKGRGKGFTSTTQQQAAVMESLYEFAKRNKEAGGIATEAQAQSYVEATLSRLYGGGEEGPRRNLYERLKRLAPRFLDRGEAFERDLEAQFGSPEKPSSAVVGQANTEATIRSLTEKADARTRADLKLGRQKATRADIVPIGLQRYLARPGSVHQLLLPSDLLAIRERANPRQLAELIGAVETGALPNYQVGDNNQVRETLETLLSGREQDIVKSGDLRKFSQKDLYGFGGIGASRRHDLLRSLQEGTLATQPGAHRAVTTMGRIFALLNGQVPSAGNPRRIEQILHSLNPDRLLSVEAGAAIGSGQYSLEDRIRPNQPLSLKSLLTASYDSLNHLTREQAGVLESQLGLGEQRLTGAAVDDPLAIASLNKAYLPQIRQLRRIAANYAQFGTVYRGRRQDVAQGNLRFHAPTLENAVGARTVGGKSLSLQQSVRRLLGALPGNAANQGVEASRPTLKDGPLYDATGNEMDDYLANLYQAGTPKSADAPSAAFPKEVIPESFAQPQNEEEWRHRRIPKALADAGALARRQNEADKTPEYYLVEEARVARLMDQLGFNEREGPGAIQHLGKLFDAIQDEATAKRKRARTRPGSEEQYQKAVNAVTRRKKALESIEAKILNLAPDDEKAVELRKHEAEAREKLSQAELKAKEEEAAWESTKQAGVQSQTDKFKRADKEWRSASSRLSRLKNQWRKAVRGNNAVRVLLGDQAEQVDTLEQVIGHQETIANIGTIFQEGLKGSAATGLRGGLSGVPKVDAIVRQLALTTARTWHISQNGVDPATIATASGQTWAQALESANKQVARLLGDDVTSDVAKEAFAAYEGMSPDEQRALGQALLTATNDNITLNQLDEFQVAGQAQQAALRNALHGRARGGGGEPPGPPIGPSPWPFYGSDWEGFQPYSLFSSLSLTDDFHKNIGAQITRAYGAERRQRRGVLGQEYAAHLLGDAGGKAYDKATRQIHRGGRELVESYSEMATLLAANKDNLPKLLGRSIRLEEVEDFIGKNAEYRKSARDLSTLRRYLKKNDQGELRLNLDTVLPQHQDRLRELIANTPNLYNPDTQIINPEVVNDLHGKVGEARGAFVDAGGTLTEKLKGAGVGGPKEQPFFQRLGLQLERLWSYVAAGAVVYGVAQYIQTLTTELKNLSTVVAQVQGIVGTAGISDRLRIKQDVIDAAIKYGRSVQEVAQTYQLFAQAGFSRQGVREATGAALQASVGLGIPVNQATEFLLSQHALRGDEAPLTKLLDQLSRTEATRAITAQDLSVIQQRVGSLAKDLQENPVGRVGFGEVLSGAGTALVEQTRVTGDVAATSLRFMLARLASPRVVDAIQRVYGVQLGGDRPGEYAPLSDILQRLATKYEELRNDPTKGTAVANQFLATFAGARQINAAAALFDRIAEVMEVAGDSTEAFGDTMRRVQNQLDTVPGQLERLRAGMIGIVDNLVGGRSGAGLTLTKFAAGSASAFQNLTTTLPGRFLAGSLGLVAGKALYSLGDVLRQNVETQKGISPFDRIGWRARAKGRLAEFSTSDGGRVVGKLGGYLATGVASTAAITLGLAALEGLINAAAGLYRIGRKAISGPEVLRGTRELGQDPFFQQFQQTALGLGTTPQGLIDSMSKAMTKAFETAGKAVGLSGQDLASKLLNDKDFAARDTRTIVGKALVEELSKNPAFKRLFESLPEEQRGAKALELATQASAVGAGLNPLIKAEVESQASAYGQEVTKSLGGASKALSHPILNFLLQLTDTQGIERFLQTGTTPSATQTAIQKTFGAVGVPEVATVSERLVELAKNLRKSSDGVLTWDQALGKAAQQLYGIDRTAGSADQAILAGYNQRTGQQLTFDTFGTANVQGDEEQDLQRRAAQRQRLIYAVASYRLQQAGLTDRVAVSREAFEGILGKTGDSFVRQQSDLSTGVTQALQTLLDKTSKANPAYAALKELLKAYEKEGAGLSSSAEVVRAAGAGRIHALNRLVEVLAANAAEQGSLSSLSRFYQGRGQGGAGAYTSRQAQAAGAAVEALLRVPFQMQADLAKLQGSPVNLQNLYNLQAEDVPDFVDQLSGGAGGLAATGALAQQRKQLEINAEVIRNAIDALAASPGNLLQSLSPDVLQFLLGSEGKPGLYSLKAEDFAGLDEKGVKDILVGLIRSFPELVKAAGDLKDQLDADTLAFQRTTAALEVSQDAARQLARGRSDVTLQRTGLATRLAESYGLPVALDARLAEISQARDQNLSQLALDRKLAVEELQNVKANQGEAAARALEIERNKEFARRENEINISSQTQTIQAIADNAFRRLEERNTRTTEAGSGLRSLLGDYQTLSQAIKTGTVFQTALEPLANQITRGTADQFVGSLLGPSGLFKDVFPFFTDPIYDGAKLGTYEGVKEALQEALGSEVFPAGSNVGLPGGSIFGKLGGKALASVGRSGGGLAISGDIYDQLIQSVGFPAGSRKNLQPIMDALKEQGMLDTAGMQAALATARIEARSGGVPGTELAPLGTKNVEEYFNRIYGTKNGNFLPGDGYRYRGRGYIQLTGRGNYAAAGQALGLPLLENPELATDPANAARILVWYMRTRGTFEKTAAGDYLGAYKTINKYGKAGNAWAGHAQAVKDTLAGGGLHIQFGGLAGRAAGLLEKGYDWLRDTAFGTGPNDNGPTILSKYRAGDFFFRRGGQPDTIVRKPFDLNAYQNGRLFSNLQFGQGALPVAPPVTITTQAREYPTLDPSIVSGSISAGTTALRAIPLEYLDPWSPELEGFAPGTSLKDIGNASADLRTSGQILRDNLINAGAGLVGQIGGAAIGGGGRGAQYGSGLGSAAGGWAGGQLLGFLGTAAGPVGTVVGGLLGGLLGGLFDKKPEAPPRQLEALDRIERNTRDTALGIRNQSDLLSLDSRLLNVPATFTVPSYRPLSVGSGQMALAAPGNMTVSITINDATNPEAVAKAVSSELSRSMRSAGLYVPAR